jgi:hypothetical protein
MRDRLLVRHFLARFMEHDLISANADRRAVVAVVGGTLIAGSLFASVLIGWWYQLNIFVPPGLASVRAIDDRFLFVSASMLVMALLAVAQWDALSLDARDTAVLGILPISKAVIIRAKFLAVALLAAGTAVACNLAPTLLRCVAVPIGLPIGVHGALILTLAHGTVTLAASAFGFLAIFGLREGLVAVLGLRFRSISSVLQAALLVVLTSALLLLPGTSMNVARRWIAPESLARTALPPVWFVGLHETLAGSVIDDVPRTQPKRFLVVPERAATTLYRSLWPVYRRLGRLAVEALGAALLLTMSACAWNSRRLPTPHARRRSRIRAVSRVWQWTVEHAIASSPLQQAGFSFTLQTLRRRLNHRVALASSLAVGLSLMVITVRERIVMIHSDASTIPVTILAAQSLLITSVLTGFRHAVQMPSELRASRTFSLAWTGDVRSYLSGVKRAAFIGLGVPVLTILALWHAALLPLRVAVLHFGVGAAYSILLIEVLLLRYRRVPFVSSYEPTVEIKSQGVLYVVIMLCLSFALAGTERFAFQVPLRYVVLMSAIVGLTAAAVAFDRARLDVPPVLDFEEQSSFPIVRLGLAQ